MSKQFRLYVLPTDVENLICELGIHFAMRILSEISLTEEAVELSSPILGYSSWFTGDATSIRCYLAPLDGRIHFSFYPKLDRWMIQSSSEVIQFSGCDFNGATLLIGRFYFQTRDLIDGKFIEKRTGFLDWADRIFRYSKSFLKREPGLDAFVGNDAAKFRESGGRLAYSMKAVDSPSSE